MYLHRRIGNVKFDLDGVLINFAHVAKEVLKAEGYTVNPTTEFKWTTTPELSNTQIWKRFKHAYTLWRITPIFDGAKELLRAVYDLTGKPVSIITARPTDYATETFKVIERVTDVPFTVAITEGSQKFAHLEPHDIIVEDRRRTVLQLAEIGIRSLLIDRKYNQIENPPPQVERVGGLLEIEEMLPQLFDMSIERER